MKNSVSSRKLIALTGVFGVALATTPLANVAIALEAQGSPAKTEVLAQVSGNIVDIASSTSDFSTLVSALEAADLVDALAGDGPFTVFAPTNEAFAALPDGFVETLLQPENRDLLTEVLTYHVVSGEVLSDDLETGSVAALSGDELYVDTEDGITIDGVDAVAADIPASNGVIHVIDEVLVPVGLVAEVVDRMEVEEVEVVEETTIETITPAPVAPAVRPQPVPARPVTTTTTTPAPQPASQTSTPAPVRGLW